jgi:hypothetical protein
MPDLSSGRPLILRRWIVTCDEAGTWHAVDRTKPGEEPVCVALAVIDRFGDLVVQTCPYCQKRHRHGGAQPMPTMRLSHCADHTRRRSYLLLRNT